MARKPTGRGRGGARRGSAPRAAPAAGPRDRIVEALMTLIAGRRFSAIGLAGVAAAAGVSLDELRDLYDGKIAILADFSKRIDRIVLAGGDAEGERARDRLFDILMRRLDALAPYKPALHRLGRAARCDPGLACSLYRIAERSMMWMLARADIRHGGWQGRIAIGGTVLVFADTMRVFVEDDDPGLARTMATLDRALARGERAMAFLSEVCDLAKPFANGAGHRSGSADAKAAG